MDSGRAGEITRLASRWSDGDAGALDRLIALVYDDLKAIAHRHLSRGERDVVIDTTMLVHEAYVRLAGSSGATWQSQAQFFAFCSTAMRRILIDFARRRRAAKRGGTRIRVPLSDDTASVDAGIEDLLVVDQVLSRLDQRSPRMARVVECRFFAGLSVDETAQALAISSRTVEREWSRARRYLRSALHDGGEA
ncbi:MAG: sigma-70 family RNA polymerase sigma factor [Gemmatimonadetes bacterium]|nr:sigma-70 family RNA polymerase sigma factor [Gemmatimonadota bacterium]NNK64559.1 sigma-70 family RNA polymerase sigma factor [Gemmatimonadota bacterium]